jgi:hypothetical protein
MAYACRAMPADLCLEALELSDGQPKGCGCPGISDVAVDSRLNELVLL